VKQIALRQQEHLEKLLLLAAIELQIDNFIAIQARQFDPLGVF